MQPLHEIWRDEVREYQQRTGRSVVKLLETKYGYKPATIYAWLEPGDDQRCRLPLQVVLQVALDCQLYGTVAALCRSLGGDFVPPIDACGAETADLAHAAKEANDVVQLGLQALADGNGIDAAEAHKLRPEVAEAVSAYHALDRRLAQIEAGERNERRPVVQLEGRRRARM